MDQDFLNQLEDQFSNVGLSECWKRDVAGRVLWFSPIPGDGQAKVNDTLASADLGVNVIFETKRLSLAHAIVGIDDVDLRKWRFSGPVFPVHDARLGKEVKVDLANYVRIKMGTWGAEFIDRAFEVFADLMESHKKDSLKNVRFENAKDPIEELAELEARAGELRTQLGMPLLTEIREEAVEEADRRDAPSEEPEEAPRQRASERSRPSQPDAPPTVDFDPFAPVQARPEPHPAQPVAPAQTVQDVRVPEPVVTVPIPVPARAPAVVPHSAARHVSKEFGSKAVPAVGKEGSSPERPFQGTPSVQSDILEEPAVRTTVPLPVLDKVPGGINPRFARTTR